MYPSCGVLTTFWRLFSKCQRQLCHFKSSTVAKLWVESCSPYHLFSLKSVEFWLLSGLWGNVRPRTLEIKKGLWWTPLFCNLNLGRFVLIEKGACLWERLQFLAQTQMWSFANALGRCIFLQKDPSPGEGWGWILG